MKLSERCQSIELILSDVDGVLTDGGVTFDNKGIELKRFHIRDGSGIKLWQRAGGRFGLITGRTSHIVEVRAAELGIEIVRQGTDNKVTAAQEVMAELRLKPEQVCYVGDDLPDLPVLRRVGLGVAVGDACLELRDEAHLVTRAVGGSGAIREVIETVLKQQQRWSDLVQIYYT
ncbi:MAG: HAD hydrolase family protein [Pirellulales bacterium]|nr:HAD hydrolase family protein [Pirellulales bacterium]